MLSYPTCAAILWNATLKKATIWLHSNHCNLTKKYLYISLTWHLVGLNSFTTMILLAAFIAVCVMVHCHEWKIFENLSNYPLSSGIYILYPDQNQICPSGCWHFTFHIQAVSKVASDFCFYNYQLIICLYLDRNCQLTVYHWYYSVPKGRNEWMKCISNHLLRQLGILKKLYQAVLLAVLIFISSNFAMIWTFSFWMVQCYS